MISVVIPLYNKENAIVRTLDSVLAQTYWAKGDEAMGDKAMGEVIIVNDGSTDQSAQVVRDWLEVRGKRLEGVFQLINKENGGVSSARNKGVEEAKGDYVAFLDGDDLWEPTYLEEMVKLIGDYPGAAIYGMGLGEEAIGDRREAPEFMPRGFRGVVTDLWSDNRKMMSWTSSSVCIPVDLARKTLADEHLTHGEDLDVWLRAMLQGDAVFYNKTLAYYVKDAENRAMNHVPAINKHIVSVIDRYAEARNENREFRKAFDTQMVYFLYPYMFTEYKKEAKRLARMLDYGQLKSSMRLRMLFPRSYKWLKG